ncbi:methyltransferase domain-containing protein [Chelativorans intermedius]|uniref:Small RNA 2'-O-methyltransferase n=1 Tax=Chelativorans intermedius TaxID=515947 RepID=A0ABV6DB11_9HYPH|nr:methyltransferase domain-containing protein [Chelativorans intermedius]MCT9000217.1 methyltransferase domain-containing protein [Chelativorans intermedius]
MTSWLHEQRLAAVCAAVRQCRARSVLDLGCGDGELLTRLAAEPRIERILGVDLCRASLERARDRLARVETGGAQVALIHGCLTKAGSRLAGFDCAVLVETIEHVAPERLSSLERAIFSRMRPGRVVVTTPNAEFNPLLGVPPHRFRHPDHRFEWDRERFRRWAAGTAARHGYGVACHDVAGCHPRLGGASQMAVFDLTPAGTGRVAA